MVNKDYHSQQEEYRYLNNMKRPCQSDFDTQGDDYLSMVSSIWQLKNKL